MRFTRWEWGRTILAVLSMLLMFAVQPMEAQEGPDGDGDTVTATVVEAPQPVASFNFTESVASVGAAVLFVVVAVLSFLVVSGDVAVAQRADHWKRNRRGSEGWRPALALDSR